MNNIEIYKASAVIKCSRYKVAVISNIIKGLYVKDALEQLCFCRKGVSSKLYKLLKSSIHNAENNFNVEDVEKLKVYSIDIGPGMRLKRLYERARGRANFKHKSYTNITINLA